MLNCSLIIIFSLGMKYFVVNSIHRKMYSYLTDRFATVIGAKLFFGYNSFIRNEIFCSEFSRKIFRFAIILQIIGRCIFV